MKQHKPTLRRVVKGILAAAEEALDCDAMSAQMPAAVDVIVDGGDIRVRFPHLLDHLIVCDQCQQQFEELLEITQMAEADTLPELEQHPLFDFQQLLQRAKAIAAEREHYRS